LPQEKVNERRSAAMSEIHIILNVHPNLCMASVISILLIGVSLVF
jgi:hypothetical protein